MISFHDGMVVSQRDGLHALFHASFQRDEMTDEYRLWAAYDRDDKERAVTDTVPARYRHLGNEEFMRIVERKVDGLFSLLLEDVVSSDWRVIAEPLGLQGGAL